MDKLTEFQQKINDLKTKIAIAINESDRLIEELRLVVQFEKLVEIPAIIASLEDQQKKERKKIGMLEQKLQSLLEQYHEFVD